MLYVWCFNTITKKNTYFMHTSALVMRLIIIRRFVALPVTMMHHKKKLSGTSSAVSYWSSLNITSRLSYLPFSRVSAGPQTHPRHGSAAHHDHTKQAVTDESFPLPKKLFADAPTEETKAQQIVDKSRLLPSTPTQVDHSASSTTPKSPSLPLGAQFISSVAARTRSAAEQSPLRQPHSPNQPPSKPLAVVVPSSSTLMTAKATIMPSRSNTMTGQAEKNRKRKRRQTATPTSQPLTPTGVELSSEVGARNNGRSSDETVNHEAGEAAASGQPNSSERILRKRQKTH